MTSITIKVTNKVASVIGTPVVICGNSDYGLSFDFDAEWDAYDVKTARFVFKKDGKLQFVDIVFSGTQASAPILSGIDEVYVGVYAGELHTTTPARILCKESILCFNPEPHDEPDPDVYKQLLEIIGNMKALPTVSKTEADQVLTVNGDGVWSVRQPEKLKDQNSGKLLKFFSGTYEEWEAWTGDKTGVTFVPKGSSITAAITAAIAAEVRKLQNGETVVAKANSLNVVRYEDIQTNSDVGSTYQSVVIDTPGLYIVEGRKVGQSVNITLIISVPDMNSTAYTRGIDFYDEDCLFRLTYNSTKRTIDLYYGKYWAEGGYSPYSTEIVRCVRLMKY